MKDQDKKNHSHEIKEICNFIYRIGGSDHKPAIEDFTNMVVALAFHHGLSLEVLEHTCECMIKNFKELKG